MRRVKLIPAAESGPPDVTIGDLVQCRDAGGRWITMIALAPPRYDIASAFGRTCWMSVPVVDPDDWDAGPGRARWCNWPADAVCPDPEHRTRHVRWRPPSLIRSLNAPENRLDTPC